MQPSEALSLLVRHAADRLAGQSPDPLSGYSTLCATLPPSLAMSWADVRAALACLHWVLASSLESGPVAPALLREELLQLGMSAQGSDVLAGVYGSRLPAMAAAAEREDAGLWGLRLLGAECRRAAAAAAVAAEVLEAGNANDA
jgi:hypothetical protein